VPTKRRRYDRAFKQQLLALVDEPGASLAAVAMAHDINPNQLARWRRELARAPRPHFIEIRPLPSAPELASPAKLRVDPPPVIDLDVGGGHLRVTGNADPDLVRLVLAALTVR
jgi:transposase